MVRWSEVDGIGREQWGLLTKGPALGLMGKATLERYRRDGLLVVVYPGAYRLVGAPLSWRQRTMAAGLAYGRPVAASHRSAAVLWGLEGVAAKECELTIPHTRSGRFAGILTHRAPLPPADLTRRERIPVTSVGRTLLDLRGVVPRTVLERAVDQAYRQHLVAPQELSRLEAERSGGGYRPSATQTSPSPAGWFAGSRPRSHATTWWRGSVRPCAGARRRRADRAAAAPKVLRPLFKLGGGATRRISRGGPRAPRRAHRSHARRPLPVRPRRATRRLGPSRSRPQP
jgi:hypothetical protein